MQISPFSMLQKHVSFHDRKVRQPDAGRGESSRAKLRLLTSRLSQMPLASFASVFASSGATSIRSAHRLSSMCRTGSERPRHSCGQHNVQVTQPSERFQGQELLSRRARSEYCL